jgi:hypothetical protein
VVSRWVFTVPGLLLGALAAHLRYLSWPSVFQLSHWPMGLSDCAAMLMHG